MITVLDQSCFPKNTREFVRFLRDYGVECWTFHYHGRDKAKPEHLRAALAGVPSRTSRVGPGIAEIAQGQRKLLFWDLDTAAEEALLNFDGSFLLNCDFSWYFQGKISVLAAGEPRRIQLYIDSYRQQALFRRGFMFNVEYDEGRVHRYCVEDLDENKSWHLRRKSLTEILASPYGMDSFPPTYRMRVDLDRADNPHILKWWTKDHDELLRVAIERSGATWWPPRTALIELIDRPVWVRWQHEDSACWNSSWADVLIDFARARAERIGLTREIAYAAVCSACGRGYDPNLIGPALRRRINVDQCQICDYCLSEAMLRNGSSTASREDIIAFLCDVSAAIGRVPSTSILVDSDEINALPPSQLVCAVNALRRKPSRDRVNDVFGSWLAALVEAELLESAARPTSRGTQCLADDGHLCRSLAEKTIDDYLFRHGVEHEREVVYADGRFRCDFVVDGVLVEYFGLIGDPEYEQRHKAKLEYCANAGIELLSLYPEDIIDPVRFKKKLKRIVPA